MGDRYEVVGHHPVAGVAPGGTVTLDLPDGNIAALVAAGHVEPAPAHVCHCGFEAKSARGLSTHERTHDSEDG